MAKGSGLALGSTISHENHNFALYDEVFSLTKPGQLNIADAIVFWGGSDIGTKIYKQVPNKFVVNEKPSVRDLHEISIANEAIKRGIPMIGVCRGAQLLCCLAGGSLLQHIQGHGQNHNVVLCDEDQTTIPVTSSHHQMMILPSDAKILAYAEHRTTGVGEFNRQLDIVHGPEEGYVPSINDLLIQPHPEWMSQDSDFVNWINKFIENEWGLPPIDFKDEERNYYGAI